MERFGSHMWRHGLAIAGVKRSQPSALKTVLLTLPWLVLSAVASDSESFPGSATQTPATLSATHEVEIIAASGSKAVSGAECISALPTRLIRIARRGH